MTPHQQRIAKNAVRFRQVLDARKQGLTLDAVGKLLGISRERARQLEAAGIKHFKIQMPQSPPKTPSKAALLKKDLEAARRQILDLCRRLSAIEPEVERANKAAADFRTQMLNAGIKKVWGGALSVDYDKFLDALGPEQELKFKAVLEERLSITV